MQDLSLKEKKEKHTRMCRTLIDCAPFTAPPFPPFPLASSAEASLPFPLAALALFLGAIVDEKVQEYVVIAGSSVGCSV